MDKQVYRYRFIKTNKFKDGLTENCHRENGYNFDFEYHCVDSKGNKIQFPTKGKYMAFNRWYILKRLKPLKEGEYFEIDVNVN